MSDATSDTSTARGSTRRKESSPAPRAGGPIDEVVGPARLAIRPGIDTTPVLGPRDGHDIGPSPLPTPRPILNFDASGSEPAPGAGKASPNSDERSLNYRASPGRWKTPHDIMELAAQANVLATQLLNGEASPPIVRSYAAVTRTIAQLLKAEIERRRWIDGPELTLPNEEVIE